MEQRDLRTEKDYLEKKCADIFVNWLYELKRKAKETGLQ